MAQELLERSGSEEEGAPAAEGGAAPARGAELVRRRLAILPNEPGVYRMLDEKGQVLYVGKASSLKKRVAAYANPHKLPARLQRMVALTRDLEVVTTNSEVEALLLEANLIKRYRPPFNIVLRDDKSFPYIALRCDHPFPQLFKYRGPKRPGTEYFGPFASAGAVNATLNALLRAFPLRSCADTVFESRSRPCLLYQIKRCSAPCVGRIGPEEYARLVAEVRDFLSGRSREVHERLKREMTEAADRLDFETAAVYRDRLRALAHVQSQQEINTEAVADADVIALAVQGAQACIQVFFYRDGRNYGNRAYFPAHTKDSEPGEILQAFVAQFYAERTAPPLLLLSDPVPEPDLLSEALSVSAGRKVEMRVPRRGEKRRLLELALRNAKEALARRIAELGTQAELLAELAERLGLDAPPERIEVYDNSHVHGAHAVGVFVVAGREGFDRRAYRTFAIKSTELAPGDDYAMLREVLRRRFGRLASAEGARESGEWPDLVIVDGGAGQLGAALAVLEELGIRDLPVLAIAKGPEREAGCERFFMAGREPFTLDPRDPVLYFLQRLRDEAHRFAVATHRGRRAKAARRSLLDAIPGVGARRKRALLQHFGSVRAIAQAGLADLERVPGINRAVARAIYDHFHDSG
ncbi:MAG: excinuclease ABC subunit UvrC [Geminicoccaceae bacterium]|nr:excinuclease ABC subunit UvrC [Geminicoccaceae bacterium]